MQYLKSFFFNFLVIFFANYLLPGIMTTDMTKWPHLGSDLPFAFLLGLLNAVIHPALKVFHIAVTFVKIALALLLLNFVVYALPKIAPIGIHISSIEGYVLPATCVSIASFLIHFFEMRRKKCEPISMPIDTHLPKM